MINFSIHHSHTAGPSPLSSTALHCCNRQESLSHAPSHSHTHNLLGVVQQASHHTMHTHPTISLSVLMSAVPNISTLRKDINFTRIKLLHQITLLTACFAITRAT